MLKEENELLTRTGPGTPMGRLMRQYWIPALLSSELPAPDCPPIRVRLLGENLIAFRDTLGRVGLLADNCSHRGASLFFGRNEDGGLRCVYHGWKYDVDGRCVDMPNEPAFRWTDTGGRDPGESSEPEAQEEVETSFADKIRHLAYPCRERGGVVWTYMGPDLPARSDQTGREVRGDDQAAAPRPAAGPARPPLPNLAANTHSGEECRPWAAQRHCNWLQGLEGDIDLTHAAFLHSFLTPRWASRPGTFAYYSERAKVPLPFLVQKDYGVLYGLRYPAEDDSYLWLIGHFLLPFYTMVNSIDLGVQFVTRAWVPIDDEHVMFWYFWWAPEGLREPDPQGGRQAFSYMRDFDYLPNTSDWRGRWQLAANASNDYEMDRQLQRTKNYTGIATVHNQDQAMTESMGPIVDRTQEHTGPADGTIITARKSLINAARDLTERGVVHVTVNHPELYELRSGRIVLPRDTDWIEATEEQRKALASAAQT